LQELQKENAERFTALLHILRERELSVVVAEKVNNSYGVHYGPFYY
jgi:hypothetical protein